MPDTLITTAQQPVTVTQATEFVVVSFWQKESGRPDGSYHYEPFTREADAYKVFGEYERGEYAMATAIGIFYARHGMPIGGKLPL